ncbi:MAG: succinate dehydrogenase cytochrome b subunit [Bacteroidota bacterium]|nr:succinate dehydrogenase cytochrome b subunit [Bacteroidota bacterium]MDP3146894.1 succinate dehydrogenase cytochrome b subunit [Bacteroidota bacterium]
MSKKPGFLSSSIGKKFLMGITGLFLISFLVVHVSLNSAIFFNDGGVTFNAGADFMAHNPVIRILEIGLFAGLILHIFQSLVLTLENKKARPVAYQVVNGSANSSWYSRSMGLLGSLLLLFLVVHLANFWVPTKVAVFSHTEHNTFNSMKEVFAHWYFVLIYLVGVIGLLFHLLHGFQSAFQSLGINHKKYTPHIKKAGVWFSIIVCALFAAMPIVIHLGLIK